MNGTSTTSLFDRFRRQFAVADPIEALRDGLIGKTAAVNGPFGTRPLIYADYVASGRALAQIENTILEDVLPFYANSHTEASYCGNYMTRLRRAARAEIATACGAGAEHAVVFCGSGATAGLNRLVHLLGIAEAVRAGKQPLVVVGPYEHHSNILPWRESGAEVIAVPEGPRGGPDIEGLHAVLERVTGRLCVGAFSAASNVTGHLTDIVEVTRILNEAGALSVWDYAGGGPYLPIAMEPAADAVIDAVVVSPHKFVGGPGSSGVLIVRRDAVVTDRPTWPGGGTVQFVSPQGHDFATAVEAREEAGTPNVIGDIRAALAFVIKDVVGGDRIAERNAHLRARALNAWSGHTHLRLLGKTEVPSLPFFSFQVRDGRGGYVHQQLFTRMLSDVHGIQARGGCACAGPYAHRLLGIDDDASAILRGRILSGEETDKPGFVRLNLSFLLSDAEADHLIEAVSKLAREAAELADQYRVERETAIFRHQSECDRPSDAA